ncbi:MAG: YIP1 family protein [Chitinophagaceae bacterium]|nr:YIP1 family protein [Chitinophagaceae bacterium]
MNIIERVKNILITPKTEWEVINGETATAQSLLMSYVLPLSVIGAAGTLLKGLLFAGTFSWGLKFFIVGAVIALVASVVAYYITVILVDMLAPSFASEKDMGKSAQLVAYSGTASYIGALLSFVPVVGWLISLAAWAYGIYLMYLGIGPLKKTPEDKKVVYMLVVYVIMIVLYFVLVAILGAILYAAMGMTAGSMFR